MRHTSLAAYRALQQSGALSSMRWVVYDCLFHFGPMTRSELDARLRGKATVNPSYHKRLCELERMGVVARFGTRPCSVTGRDCFLWDVTPASSVTTPGASKGWKAKALGLASAMKKLEDYLRGDGLDLEADFLRKEREKILCASGP